MSTSPVSSLIAATLGTISVSFGINAILRPEHALSFFEFDYPTIEAQQNLVNNLLIVYGIRDIFMGFAIYATAWCGSRRALGWIILAMGAVAVGDGVVCWRNGHGEWNHWGYAPLAGVVGALFVGMAG